MEVDHDDFGFRLVARVVLVELETVKSSGDYFICVCEYLGESSSGEWLEHWGGWLSYMRVVKVTARKGPSEFSDPRIRTQLHRTSTMMLGNEPALCS